MADACPYRSNIKPYKILGRSDCVAIVMGERRGSLLDKIFELVEIWGGLGWRLSSNSAHLRLIFQNLAKSNIWATRCLFGAKKISQLC